MNFFLPSKKFWNQNRPNLDTFERPKKLELKLKERAEELKKRAEELYTERIIYYLLKLQENFFEKVKLEKVKFTNIIPKNTRHKRDIVKKTKNYIIGNSIKDALDKYKPFNLKGTDMHKGKIYLVTNPLRLEHEDLKYKLWLGSYSNSILRDKNRDLTKSESNLYRWCKYIYMDIFNKIYIKLILFRRN